MAEILIIPVTAACANLSDMVRAVSGQTGDDNPFFCPKVVEGQPYDGHAHTSPPFGATNPSKKPIILK